MIAPRKGLLTSEFGSVIDMTASAIRAEIRRGKLPGMPLRARGNVYAYAATVDDIAAYYELPPRTICLLRSLTCRDITGRFASVGIPLIDQSRQVEIPTEFENPEEFENANS